MQIIKHFGLGRHLLRQTKLSVAQMPPYGILFSNKTFLNYNIKPTVYKANSVSPVWLLP